MKKFRFSYLGRDWISHKHLCKFSTENRITKPHNCKCTCWIYYQIQNSFDQNTRLRIRFRLVNLELCFYEQHKRLLQKKVTGMGLAEGTFCPHQRPWGPEAHNSITFSLTVRPRFHCLPSGHSLFCLLFLKKRLGEQTRPDHTTRAAGDLK